MHYVYLHQAVDRALKDTVRRYERNKEQIVRMKENENHQKEMVSTVQVRLVMSPIIIKLPECLINIFGQDRLKREQDRYELLKTDANEKLSNANVKLSSIRSSKEAEILKLKALLKKSELKVSALGWEIKLIREAFIKKKV